jgi:hypothetical protein
MIDFGTEALGLLGGTGRVRLDGASTQQSNCQGSPADSIPEAIADLSPQISRLHLRARR